MSDTYEFNRFRRISPSGDMNFMFREGDRLTNVSIMLNKRGKLTIRLHVRRINRGESDSEHPYDSMLNLSRELQADRLALLDEEEK